jgi:ribose transport system substrate-binding protein
MGGLRKSLSRRQFLGGTAAGLAGLAAMYGLGDINQVFAAAKEPKDITLGLCMKSFTHPFYIAVQNGAKRAAQELGVNIQIVATSDEHDVDGQMKQIENLITKKVDVLGVTPNDSQAVVSGIKAANDAGIPFFLVDTPASGGNFQGFIGTENYGACHAAAKWLGDKMGGKGKLAILEGIPGNESTRLRVGGTHDELKAEFPNIEIVASLPANYDMETGLRVTEDILTKQSELDAIFATNDEMARGALRATEAAGRKDKIFIMGLDGEAEALELVNEGRLNADVAQKPVLMGELFVLVGLRAAQGRQVPYNIDCGTTIVEKKDALNWIQQDDKQNWVLK